MDYAVIIAEIVDWIITVVFKNIVLFACPVIVYMLLVRSPNESKKPELGCYSIPGRAFHFKRIWALFCLHKLRLGKKKKIDSKRSTNGLLPSNEEILGEEPKNFNKLQGMDNICLFGIDNEKNMLLLRIVTERLEHRLYPEVWIHACIDGEIYQLPMHPDTGLPSTGPASHAPSSLGMSYMQAAGLKFEICEPMRKWRVQFNGILRKGAHKEMTSFQQKELVHAKFNFIWTACSPPYYVHKDYNLSLVSEALAREPWRSGDWINAMRDNQKGYDQWGTLYGEWQVLELGSTTKVLHLRGIRRRRYGPPADKRDNISLRHKVEFLGVSKQGSFFSVGASCMDIGGLTHEHFGHFRNRAGVCSSIDSSDISLPKLAHFGNIPEHVVLRFSAIGKSYTTSIRFLKLGETIFYTGRPWKYKICIAMIDFGLNSDEGFGISEFIYRYDGPCPISTQDSKLVSQYYSKLSINLGETLTKQEKQQLEESKPLVLHFDDPLCQNSKIVGGKGSSLAVTSSITGASFKVPSGFCLTIFAFRLQLESNKILQDIISEVKNASLKGEENKKLQDICKRAVNIVSTTPVCPAVVEAVEKGVEHLKEYEDAYDNYGFAVRSSAIGEDSQELSAAGQNATVLGCKSQEKIIDALKTCWASLFAFPSVIYRRLHGMIIHGSDIAVVIQKMVPADVAGVLFTQHPFTGNPSQIVLTANYGLGESVVAAIAEPDTVTLSRSWEDTLSILESKVGEKSVKVSIDEVNGCTKEERVDDNQLNALCLSHEQALNLGHIGLLLESVFGTPRDIEWAIVKDKIFILQARPITALDNWTDFELLHEFDTPVITDTDVSTLANTGEVLPGPMTPLTSSVIAKALDLMIQKNNPRSKCLVPHYLKNAVITHHQMAMNFINTFFQANESRVTLANKVVHLAVFGHPNVPSELHRLGVERHGVMGSLEKFGYALRLLSLIIWADKVTKKSVLKSKKLDLHPENFKSAKALYEEISENYIKLLEAALAHNSVSSVGVLSQVILMSILIEGSKELTSDHHADISLLLSSCSNMVSAEIPKDLKVLASKISKSEGANEFCDASISEAVSWFDHHPGEASIYFKEFLSKHGHRCLKEFDLLSETWEMKSDCLMNTLQTMVRSAGVGQQRCNAVFEEVDCTIERLKTPKKMGTKRALKWLLPWCRRCVARREDTKSALVRTLHAFRLAYRHLGHLLQSEGVIPDPEFLFYCTHFEICQMLKNGSKSNSGLLAKISRRRILKKTQWDKIILPETFSGLAKPMKIPESSEDVECEPDDQNKNIIQVTGTSASLGVAIGRACVVHRMEDADKIRPEDILITKSTDVGWSPYFPFLSGIVTEMGGLISHGAVVAREYGLPCVIGAHSATRIFHTGDTVRLDATNGTLLKINKE